MDKENISMHNEILLGSKEENGIHSYENGCM